MLRNRIMLAAVLTRAVASSAAAQTSTGTTPTQTSQSTQTAQPAQTTSSGTGMSSDTAATRPATTTFMGDTGLWYVPTGEVLPAGKWSVSGYRRGINYVQGFSNVAD